MHDIGSALRKSGGQKVDADGYCYGFNGKEKDENGEWGSITNYDYGFRIYNPGIARFLSVDPLTKGYPMLTPYQFASNRPIDGLDLDGLEYYWFVPVQIDNHGNCFFKLVKTQDVITIETGVGPINLDLKKFGIQGTFAEHNGQWRLVPEDYLNRSLNEFTDEDWLSFKTVEEIESRVQGAASFGRVAENAVAVADLVDGIRNILKGGAGLKKLFSFSKAERAVIKEAENILSSKKLEVLKEAAKKGEFAEITIDGRKIAIEPDFASDPTIRAMTFGQDIIRVHDKLGVLYLSS